MPKPNNARTKSYLLRLWCDSTRSPWRATVYTIRTKESCHFARPEELWTYLQAEMADPDEQAEMTDQPEPDRSRRPD
jgi:hypothetical protein